MGNARIPRLRVAIIFYEYIFPLPSAFGYRYVKILNFVGIYCDVVINKTRRRLNG